MFDIKSLSYNIKKYRTAQGLSQGAFAEVLGVSAQAVSKWERGLSVPDIDNLCSMSTLFCVSVDALLGVQSFDKKVMLGVDGGGSKTEFVLFDKDGKIYAQSVLSACNPNAVGIDGAYMVLKKGIDQMLAINPAIEGIFIGSAGFSLGENVKEIKHRLSKNYPQIKIKCGTDIYNVIASCCDDEKCIAVISGTGSSVFAKQGEELTRITGWGYLLSSGGSGFDIGRDGIRATLAQMDGIGEKTAISDLVIARMGKTPSEIISAVYKNDQTFIASFAVEVFKAYDMGDEIAKKIICDNAKALAEVINFAHIHHGKASTVIASGSIFTKTETFSSIVQEFLLPNLKLIKPTCPQVLGACKLCAKNCGFELQINDEIINLYEEIKGEQENA